MDYESKVQIVENYSMLIISSIATSTTLHLQMRTHWAARYGSYKNRRHSHKLSPSKSLMKCWIICSMFAQIAMASPIP